MFLLGAVSWKLKVPLLPLSFLIMSNPPVSGGPRLGKLQGLKREEDDDPQSKKRRPSKKGGIKVKTIYVHFPVAIGKGLILFIA